MTNSKNCMNQSALPWRYWLSSGQLLHDQETRSEQEKEVCSFSFLVSLPMKLWLGSGYMTLPGTAVPEALPFYRYDCHRLERLFWFCLSASPRAVSSHICCSKKGSLSFVASLNLGYVNPFTEFSSAVHLSYVSVWCQVLDWLRNNLGTQRMPIG